MKRWLGFHSAAVEVQRANPQIKKDAFATMLAERFALQKERKLYFAEDFAVRFCESKTPSFSGTVLALEKIRKFDDRPLLVCLLRPDRVQTFLANSSFIKKVSHSSHRLTSQTIRGSINGSDIMREHGGIANTPENFEALYESHAGFTWEENFERILGATSAITPSGRRFEPSATEVELILQAPVRSQSAEQSGRMSDIERTLQKLIATHAEAVLAAAETDNVKVRGDAIERILTGEPSFHRLEDCLFRISGDITVLVDLKSKVIGLSSNPKLYNIDKTLRHLAQPNSVFSVFLIGVDRMENELTGRLVDILDSRLIAITRTQPHWAGRNSRGATQLAGDARQFFEPHFARNVNLETARTFLNKLLAAV